MFSLRICPFVGRSRPLKTLQTRLLQSMTAPSARDELKVEALGGKDRGIVVFGLNRSKQKNSFGQNLTSLLIESLEGVKYDKEARVLIVRSLVPGVFCAGADLKERLQMSPLQVSRFVASLRELMNTVEEMPVPVIAAMDGAAFGGGLEMALATDIRVASESAKMGLVETRLAIMPGAGGTQRLPRLVSPSLAKELIYTAAVLDGRRAKEVGLVNHCVPDNEEKDSAYLKALEVARAILPNGPLGVRMAKVAIDKGSQLDLRSGCKVEELCYAQVIPTKDRIEGLKAFSEKRTPVYTGE